MHFFHDVHFISPEARTHPNHSVQVFQSLLWLQVCKVSYCRLLLQTTVPRTGRLQELGEFQRGAVIGHHLCSPLVKFPSY